MNASGPYFGLFHGRRRHAQGFFLVVLCLVGHSTPALAHKEDYLDETFVYETIGRRVAEVEYRTRFLRESRRREGEEFWTNTPVVEFGLTDHTMIELASDWGTARYFTEFGGAFAQLRHRFGDEGDYPLDPALGLEYETEREAGPLGHFLVPTLVLSKDVGACNVTANAFLKRGLDNATSKPWAFQYAFGLRYGRHGVRWGAEIKALGVDRRYVLPQVTIPLTHDLTLKVGAGRRLSPNSPAWLAECLVEWEIGEKTKEEGR